jgi:hypothetical protein
MNALKFCILSGTIMLCTLPEHSRTSNFENYNRVVAALLICGVPLFLVKSGPSAHNISIEHISPYKLRNRLDLVFSHITKIRSRCQPYADQCAL